MLLDISIENKIRIGHFIKYKRAELYKETKDTKFKVQNFIKSEKGNICSLQTYNKLTKGNIVKESEIYDLLLNKLGYNYNYQKDMKEIFEKHAKNISKAMNDIYIEDKIEAIDSYLKVLKPFQTCAIENTYTEILLIIKESFLDTKFHNERDIEYLMNVYNVADKELQEIIGYVLMKYYYNYNFDEIDYLRNLIDLDVLNNEYNQLLNLSILIRSEQFYKASILCNEFEESFKNKRYKDKYVDVLLIKLFIYSCIQRKDFIRLAIKIEKYIQRLEEDDFNYCNFYHLVALFKYEEGKYESAIDYFERSIVHKAFYFPDILYLNNISTRLNKNLYLPYMTLNKVKNEHPIYLNLYRYYVDKQKGIDIEDLEKYIMQTIKKELKNIYPNHILKEMFIDELKWCTSYTGHKEKIYKFANAVE